jgi:(E)-4-hydroxy-3-methylbut-2-enyl-diphosphate synthase
MIRIVKTENLVDELFVEIDKYYDAGKRVVRDEGAAAKARAWLAENEDSTAMTPERLAALEAEAARRDDGESVEVVKPRPARLDEEQSPVAGRRFTRA